MRYLIVGGGVAGHCAAVHLRELDPGATIDLLGDERSLPYERPSLSKDVLCNGQPRFLTTQKAYDDLKISYHPGQTAVQIDRARSEVKTADGKAYGYDRLLLATGSRPRKLPREIGESQRISYLRTLDEALRLRSVLRQSRRIAVIGGGFIGLEVAAAARGSACEVLLFEMADRILSRGMPVILSNWMKRLHEANGVIIELDTKVAAIQDNGGSGLRLNWANSFTDVNDLVVGIGVQPNIELAMRAGLAVDDGINVDSRCETSDPSIFAAGEVTSHPVFGETIPHRLESWKVASEQALVAAKSMAGIHAHYAQPPWLWSDQFGRNIQSIGMPNDLGNTVLLGDPFSDRWTAIFLDHDDRVNGAVAVNGGRDISILRRALLTDRCIPDALLAKAVRRTLPTKRD